MNKFNRIVALLLVPCFLVDPARAHGDFRDSKIQNPSSEIFYAQAVIPALTSFRDADPFPSVVNLWGRTLDFLSTLFSEKTSAGFPAAMGYGTAAAGDYDRIVENVKGLKRMLRRQSGASSEARRQILQELIDQSVVSLEKLVTAAAPDEETVIHFLKLIQALVKRLEKHAAEEPEVVPQAQAIWDDLESEVSATGQSYLGGHDKVLWFRAAPKLVQWIGTWRSIRHKEVKAQVLADLRRFYKVLRAHIVPAYELVKNGRSREAEDLLQESVAADHRQRNKEILLSGGFAAMGSGSSASAIFFPPVSRRGRQIRQWVRRELRPSFKRSTISIALVDKTGTLEDSLVLLPDGWGIHVHFEGDPSNGMIFPAKFENGDWQLATPLVESSYKAPEYVLSSGSLPPDFIEKLETGLRQALSQNGNSEALQRAMTRPREEHRGLILGRSLIPEEVDVYYSVEADQWDSNTGQYTDPILQRTFIRLDRHITLDATVSEPAVEKRREDRKGVQWIARTGRFLGEHRRELILAAVVVVVLGPLLYLLERWLFDDPRDLPLPVRFWHRLYRATVDRFVSVEGLEHMQRGQRYLMVGNHVNFMGTDTILLMSRIAVLFAQVPMAVGITNPRRLFWRMLARLMAYYEIILKTSGEARRQPGSPQEKGEKTVERMIEYLVDHPEGILVVHSAGKAFPEGDPDEFGDWRTGAAAAALATETPILPFYISGVPFNSTPIDLILHFLEWFIGLRSEPPLRMTIRIGTPIPAFGGATRENARALTEELKAAVQALKPAPAQRGGTGPTGSSGSYAAETLLRAA